MSTGVSVRIPYTNYPALACYWVRRPQYVRENIIQRESRTLLSLESEGSRHARQAHFIGIAAEVSLDLGSVPRPLA
jgi:hypothetical protein